MKASDIKRGNVVEYNNKVWQIATSNAPPTARGGNVTFRSRCTACPEVLTCPCAPTSSRKPKSRGARSPTSYGRFRSWTSRLTQHLLGRDSVGDAAGYITDGLEGCYVQLIEGQAVALQLPPTVTLKVVDTAPELRGATATKRPKPAKLNTGIEIQVPEYITTGEKVLVTTTPGEFSGRA
jgi:elongation factor P